MLGGLKGSEVMVFTSGSNCLQLDPSDVCVVGVTPHNC